MTPTSRSCPLHVLEHEEQAVTTPKHLEETQHRLSEPGLTDSWLASQHDDLAVASPRLVCGVGEIGDLHSSANHNGAPHSRTVALRSGGAARPTTRSGSWY
jgi:hypothetical protein